jgi:hypothetical protein
MAGGSRLGVADFDFEAGILEVARPVVKLCGAMGATQRC